MNAEALVSSLARLPEVLPALVSTVSDDDLHFRPADGGWSILEILCHLLDEEREDFRPRLRSTLEDPTREWRAIDPEGWVTQRLYSERDRATTLREILVERESSLAWLRSLQEPDWSQTHVHPRLGPLRAGNLLASWAVHDLLHYRQILRRLFERNREASGEYSSLYAGPW
jgi:hypothetical protein